MLLDRSGQGKVYGLIGRRRFQQMDVLEGLNLLITISGACLNSGFVSFGLGGERPWWFPVLCKQHRVKQHTNGAFGGNKCEFLCVCVCPSLREKEQTSGILPVLAAE